MIHPEGHDPDAGLSRREIKEFVQEDDLTAQALDYLGISDEDSDADSSEDVLEQISLELTNRLGIFGIRGLNEESIMRLWHKMGMDSTLVGDLALYAITQKQQITHNPFSKPNVNDLDDVADTYENPFKVRSDLVELVVPNLVSLGLNQRQSYKLAQAGPERQSAAMRFCGWVAGQHFMSDLPQLVQSEMGAGNGKIKLSKLIGTTAEEVKRQLKIHQASPREGKYNLEIGYEREAYEEVEKQLRDTIKMCDLMFFGRQR